MTDGRVLAFVGTLNRPVSYFPQAHGSGIAVCAYDEASGALTKLHEEKSVDNPGYLILNASGTVLYAVSEISGWHEGIVSAYALDRSTGKLTYINKQATLGSITAHASIDATGRWLFVTNYRSGPDGLRPPQAVVVYPIDADGGIGAPVARVAHTGSGPNPARQEGPHPHCAVPSPDNRHLVVADLGIDQVLTYAFDPASGVLSLAHTLSLSPGSGPRSIAFHPSQRLLFVTLELGSAVASVRWDPTGRTAPIAVTGTLPDGWAGESTCADLAVSPDGRFVYVANRGHDSVAVFAVVEETGELTLLQHIATGGKTPRHITLDLTSTLLLVANQDGDLVTSFRRDPSSGRLADEGQRSDIGTPMCVRLLRTNG
jgi:6-phosphogluconolactonase